MLVAGSPNHTIKPHKTSSLQLLTTKQLTKSASSNECTSHVVKGLARWTVSHIDLWDFKARQLSHLGSGETIDGVGTDLKCQLSAIQHLLSEQITLQLQVFLGSVTVATDTTRHDVDSRVQSSQYATHDDYIYHWTEEPRPQSTCTNNLLKFSHAVFKICKRTNKQTETDTLITTLHTP